MNRPKKYQRYQDYVIRDGRLVGEFEEMYRDFDDPWGQSVHEAHALDKIVGMELASKHGHRRALEYGCGLGHYTEQLGCRLGYAAGIDISGTAIARATERYPEREFFVDDITGRGPLLTVRPDILIFAEITWYVLGKLGEFKKLIAECCPGIGFVHLLTIYPPGTQKYGAEYFRTLDEIRTYWADAIDVIEWGSVGGRFANGTERTFFYGRILSPC